MIKYIYILPFIFLTLFAKGQQQNIPLNRQFDLVDQKVRESYGLNNHTSFKPLLQSTNNFDSIKSECLSPTEIDYYNIRLSKTKLENRSWFMRKLLYENFILIDTQGLYLTIDPLFNFEIGNDAEALVDTNQIYTNTRGAIIRGNIGEKFSFTTSFYENQAFFPDYVNSYVSQTSVVPGQGRVKTFKNKNFDFFSSNGYLSYSPTNYLNIQLGNDKHFVGDGYRSLLLSDNGYYYPYIKATVSFCKNKLQYTKLHATLSNLNRTISESTAESLFERKTLSVHYLSWLPTKWLHIGFFESIIWNTMDSNSTKPFNAQVLNPIMYVNTLTEKMETDNNALLGLNLKVKTPYKTVLYSQFSYDGNKQTEKYGYQFGVKNFSINNLTLQAEYNYVSPFTYSSSNTLQNYSHYNQPLSHPLGAGFTELVLLTNYKYKRLFTELKFNIANYESYGTNIFAPDNFLGLNQSKKDVMLTQAHIGYLINPKNGLAIVTGLTQRSEQFNKVDNKTNYIFFALRTNLRNIYTDF